MQMCLVFLHLLKHARAAGCTLCLMMLITDQLFNRSFLTQHVCACITVRKSIDYAGKHHLFFGKNIFEGVK